MGYVTWSYFLFATVLLATFRPLDLVRAVATQIAVPQVVGKDQDDIWPICGGGREDTSKDCKQAQMREAYHGFFFRLSPVTPGYRLLRSASSSSITRIST